MTVAVGGGMGKSSVLELLRAMAEAAGYRVRVEANDALSTGSPGQPHAPGVTAIEGAPAAVTRAAVDDPAPPDLTLLELRSPAGPGQDPPALDVLVLLPGGVPGRDVHPASWFEALRPGATVVAGGGLASMGDHGIPDRHRLVAWQRDYRFDVEAIQWRWTGPRRRLAGLAHPALRGVAQVPNAAVALAVLDALALDLPVPVQAVRTGLATALLPGRFQSLPGQPALVLDLAHTEQAARALALSLDRMGYFTRTTGLIADGPGSGMVPTALGAVVDDWQQVRAGADAPARLAGLLERADPTDRLLVCGSYAIVAAVIHAGLPRLRAAHVA